MNKKTVITLGPTSWHLVDISFKKILSPPPSQKKLHKACFYPTVSYHLL